MMLMQLGSNIHCPKIVLGCSLFGVIGHPEVKFSNFGDGFRFKWGS